MNRNELVDLIKSGKKVTLNIVQAKVVFAKGDYIPVYRGGHSKMCYVNKIIVDDPTLGSIFFSGFSQKLRAINHGNKISLKVTVTGVGDPSQRYPNPILFAKAHTRKGDSVVIDETLGN